MRVIRDFASKAHTTPFVAGIILVLFSLILFSPTLFNGFFCWDDKTVVLSPAFRHLTIRSLINTFISFHIGLYHPVTSLSFIIDFFTGNGNPFTFHLTNIVLNSLNSLLLFIFLNRLTKNQPLSFVTSLLFTALPVHVEAVAWITARKDLLFTFFSLLSLIFYLNYLEHKTHNPEKGSGDNGTQKHQSDLKRTQFRNKQRVFNYLLSIFFLSCALLSKIQAVSILFLLLLIDYHQARKWYIGIILDKIPVFILCVFFGFLNILAQKEYGYIEYGFHYSLFEKGILFIYSISKYIRIVVFPHSLSIFYPYPFKPGETIPFSVFIGPILLFLTILILVLSRKKVSRDLLFGFLFFLINILIVSGVTFNREAVIADRYTYFASAGLLLMAGVIAGKIVTLYSGFRNLIRILVILIVMILSWLTYQRNRLWKNPSDLFTHALSTYNHSDILLNTLGTLKTDEGHYADAIEQFSSAISIDPEFTDAYYNRGIAYFKSGALKQSVIDFTTAHRLNANNPEILFARGNAYMKMNMFNPAIVDYSGVLRLKHDHWGALENRAIISGNLGAFDAALEDLNKVIQLNPGFAPSYYLRGIALFNLGRNGCSDLYHALSLGYKEAAKAIDYYCR